jgi:hypothetical protein
MVPVMALAERAGLAGLVAERVRPGGECGVNAHLKVFAGTPAVNPTPVGGRRAEAHRQRRRHVSYITNLTSCLNEQIRYLNPATGDTLEAPRR